VERITSYKAFDDVDRLVTAGEVWRCTAGDIEAVNLGDHHTGFKYFVVQRDVLVTETAVPVWICTRLESVEQDPEIDHFAAGGNVPEFGSADGAELDVDISIDVMKSYSLEPARFSGDPELGERRGRVSDGTVLRCLAQQAMVMKFVSLDLRHHEV
jgi:hypothetical protein